MDWLNWALIGVALAALSLLFRKKEETTTRVSAEIHEQTRKKANALLPSAPDDAPADLFELRQSPLRIAPTARLADRYAEANVSSFDLPIADGLWARQRALLERLESELEMHQQAELSRHFAIAAPTNQPADLLTGALANAEKSLDLLIATLQPEPPTRLWHGRALILMLSNRKLFDHVAWLAEAGLSRSRGGAYTIAQEGVVMISVYATRVSDSRRIILRQIIGAFLYAYGGYGQYPRWIEEGIIRWTQTQRIGPPAPPPGADETLVPAEPSRLLDPQAWQAADDDPIFEESLLRAAGQQVDDLLTNDRRRFVDFLKGYKSNPDEAGAWQAAFGQAPQQTLARTLAPRSVAAPEPRPLEEGVYLLRNPPSTES